MITGLSNDCVWMDRHLAVTLEAALSTGHWALGLERLMTQTTGFRSLAALSLLCLSPMVSLAGDWPMWRYDAQRSAASPDELPAKLSLHWVRELPALAS